MADIKIPKEDVRGVGSDGTISPSATNRDNYYVPYTQTVQNIHNAALYALQDLVAEGHAELSAPFARILEVLASVDRAALKQLDDKYAEKHSNG